MVTPDSQLQETRQKIKDKVSTWCDYEKLNQDSIIFVDECIVIRNEDNSFMLIGKNKSKPFSVTINNISSAAYMEELGAIAVLLHMTLCGEEIISSGQIYILPWEKEIIRFVNIGFGRD